MRYSIRINRRVRNTRVYTVVKRIEGNPNILTKFFIRVFSGRKREEGF